MKWTNLFTINDKMNDDLNDKKGVLFGVKYRVHASLIWFKARKNFRESLTVSCATPDVTDLGNVTNMWQWIIFSNVTHK